MIGLEIEPLARQLVLVRLRQLLDYPKWHIEAGREVDEFDRERILEAWGIVDDLAAGNPRPILREMHKLMEEAR